MEIRFPNYTAVLELMTTNTYVMAIVADPNVRKSKPVTLLIHPSQSNFPICMVI
jgi:hypothetical protein